MVAALVSAQLFGIIGVLLAAPTLATLRSADMLPASCTIWIRGMT